MKKLMTVLATGVAVIVGASGAMAAGMDKVKACFVYVGPVGDFGWSYQHDQGRQFAEKQLAGKVETAFLESVDRKSTRLNSSHPSISRMPSSA